MKECYRPTEIFFKYLRDSDGNTNMNIDGSVTPRYFTYGRHVSEPVHLHYLHIGLLLNEYEVGQFGSLESLENGIRFGIWDDGTEILNLTNGEPIKAVEDFKMYCMEWMPNVIYEDIGKLVFIQHKLCVAPQGTHMKLSEDEYIRMEICDDLSAIPDIKVLAVGTIEV
jgi:hypothetical protein